MNERSMINTIIFHKKTIIFICLLSETSQFLFWNNVQKMNFSIAWRQYIFLFVKSSLFAIYNKFNFKVVLSKIYHVNHSSTDAIRTGTIA